MSIDLLQEIGLNKYEAEAYYTLLTQGPLTGYELGKRSQVPLSRSYDVLERLNQKGLALAQPGDPARYKALEPELFLGQVRSTMEYTLNTLAGSLIAATQTTASGEFWVIRGRQHILARVKTLCLTATQSLQLVLPTTYFAEIATCLTEARQRGCRVALNIGHLPDEANISLLTDSREGLLGTLAPEDSCQAVLSANPALLVALVASFPSAQNPSDPRSAEQMRSADIEQSDWLEWENRKQHRLWKNHADRRLA